MSNILSRQEKRTVVRFTDVTTIEDIWTGKYSSDGFQFFHKFQFNDKLFSYNVFAFHRYIYKAEKRRIHFYCCSNSKLYNKWSQLINRKDLKVTKFTKVCSNHFSAGKPTKQYPLPNLYLKGYLSNESSTKKKPPTAQNEIPCKKKKSWAPLKCMTSGERNEVQNPQIRKIRSHGQISKVSVKVCLCLQ